MPVKPEDLELEGHTVRTFRCHVNEERHSFAIEIVTKGERRMMIEFASEAPAFLLEALSDAFEEYPLMREWKSPTAH